MKGRIYDPLAGRFTTGDPVTQAPFWSQGLNRYSYVFNDPVNNTDPSGFISIVPDFGPGNWGGVGAQITGSWTGVAMGAGAAVGNVVSTIVNGDWRGSASRSIDVTPTAAPSGNGVSRLSPPAQTQNAGAINELAPPDTQVTGYGPPKPFDTGPYVQDGRLTPKARNLLKPIFDHFNYDLGRVRVSFLFSY